MGFRSLQHTKVRKSTGRERCRRPLRSACRVWLPSWRLTPSEPVPVLFHTGGALGIRPSEPSPHGRCPLRFRTDGPTYRLTHRCSRRQRRWAGPGGRGFWAFALPRVPGSRRRVSTTAAGCSLGLHPSRVYRKRPGPGSHPNSSLALCRYRPCRRHPPAPRSFNRPPLGPFRWNRQAGPSDKAALLGSSHRYVPKH
jgi:hypothetical protein